MGFKVGLDASTSSIGISVFNEKAELLKLTSFSPKKNKLDQKHMLLNKVDQFISFFESEVANKGVVEDIIIEEALISSTNINTATMLNFYQGILFTRLKQLLPETNIEFVTVNDSRKTVLREFVEKNVLWKAVPKEICGIPKSKHKKMLILNAVSQRFPEIKWSLNNNKTIDNTNYDRADSVVLGLYYFIKERLIEPITGDLSKNISIIESYYEYLDFCNDLTGSSTEKKALKKAFLEEYLKLDKIMNFDIYV